jgi:hypothetical protein
MPFIYLSVLSNPITNILKIIPTNKPTQALKKVIKTAIKRAEAISEFFLGIAIAT